MDAEHGQYNRSRSHAHTDALTMALLLAHLKVPLTWTQILRRTFNEAFFEDNCLGMAAQLAYYFFFALFPALLMLIGIASYFPYHTLVNDLFTTLGGFLPA